MKITENSSISLMVFWTLMGAVIGGVGWITKIHFLAETSAQTIEVVKVKQDEYSKDIADIKADIRVIKTILEGDR